MAKKSPQNYFIIFQCFIQTNISILKHSRLKKKRKRKKEDRKSYETGEMKKVGARRRKSICEVMKKRNNTYMPSAVSGLKTNKCTDT